MRRVYSLREIVGTKATHILTRTRPLQIQNKWIFKWIVLFVLFSKCMWQSKLCWYSAVVFFVRHLMIFQMVNRIRKCSIWSCAALHTACLCHQWIVNRVHSMQQFSMLKPRLCMHVQLIFATIYNIFMVRIWHFIDTTNAIFFSLSRRFYCAV